MGMINATPYPWAENLHVFVVAVLCRESIYFLINFIFILVERSADCNRKGQRSKMEYLQKFLFAEIYKCRDDDENKNNSIHWFGNLASSSLCYYAEEKFVHF